MTILCHSGGPPEYENHSGAGENQPVPSRDSSEDTVGQDFRHLPSEDRAQAKDHTQKHEAQLEGEQRVRQQ